MTIMIAPPQCGTRIRVVTSGRDFRQSLIGGATAELNGNRMKSCSCPLPHSYAYCTTKPMVALLSAQYGAGAALADHHAGGIGISPDQRWHDRGIGNPQVRQPMQLHADRSTTAIGSRPIRAVPTG